MPRKTNWREILNIIERNSWYAFFADGDTFGEFAWPYRMNFRAGEGFVDEVIALAWAGEPLLELAKSISKLSDGEIALLWTSIGNFRSKEVVDGLINIFDEIHELDMKFEDFLKDNPSVNLRTLKRRTSKILKKYRDKQEELEIQNRTIVKPFSTRIDLVVKNWEKQNLATSMAQGLNQRASVAAISSYLEKFIIANRVMPTGKHSTTGYLFGKPLVVTFDTDVD